MKLTCFNRRLHKWLALAVGLQALIWVASGLYMTAVPIKFIHGDHLVRTLPHAIPSMNARAIGIAELRAKWPDLHSFVLKRWMDRSVYEVRHRSGTDLVDAVSGEQLSPLDESTVRALAASHYIGTAPIRAASLLQQAPAEVGNRPAPLWQVSFADSGESTLYFSPATGELLAKRHRWWRAFDVLWMLHILDYAERSDVNNNLLRVAALLGVLLSLSGGWLAIVMLRRRRVSIA